MISRAKKNMGSGTNNAVKRFLSFLVFPYFLGLFFDYISSVFSVPSVVKDQK